MTSLAKEQLTLNFKGSLIELLIKTQLKIVKRKQFELE